MRTFQLKDAKATLSALVDHAVQGEPTVITRRGKPAAVVLGFADWQRLSTIPSFGRLLASAPIGPGDIPERDRTPLRDADV
jgi:prevent-host-death family protein